jgi:hypothetical protein
MPEHDCRSCKYYIPRMKCNNKRVNVFEIYRGKEHICLEFKKREFKKK